MKLRVNKLQVPRTWELITGIEVVDPDGWKHHSELGEKSYDEAITEEEFRKRCNESTIYEKGHTKGGHKM